MGFVLPLNQRGGKVFAELRIDCGETMPKNG
jgi:hypothetical protein